MGNFNSTELSKSLIKNKYMINYPMSLVYHPEDDIYVLGEYIYNNFKINPIIDSQEFINDIVVLQNVLFEIIEINEDEKGINIFIKFLVDIPASTSIGVYDKEHKLIENYSWNNFQICKNGIINTNRENVKISNSTFFTIPLNMNEKNTINPMMAVKINM